MWLIDRAGCEDFLVFRHLASATTTNAALSVLGELEYLPSPQQLLPHCVSHPRTNSPPKDRHVLASPVVWLCTVWLARGLHSDSASPALARRLCILVHGSAIGCGHASNFPTALSLRNQTSRHGAVATHVPLVVKGHRHLGQA